MRQAGRYLPEYRAVRAKAGSFLDLCYAPALAAEVTLQPIRRFDLDAAIIFSDILVVPQALGMALRFEEGEGPRLDPVCDARAVATLGFGRFETILAPVYEAIGRVREALPRDKSLIGFAGAPWTLAAYAIEGQATREFQSARLWALKDPQGFSQFMDLLTQSVARHLIAQLRAGADAVQIFDSWAGVLSPELFASWVISPARRIVANVREAVPQARIIGFPRGAGSHYPCFAAETGVDGVSLDTTVVPEWAATQIPGSVTVQGNLDPLALVAGGAALERETRRILSAFRGRAHIFNLGHGIVPETPPEHVAKLVHLVRESGR
jgi:uroporphyrinogen decarboxylase